MRIAALVLCTFAAGNADVSAARRNVLANGGFENWSKDRPADWEWIGRRVKMSKVDSPRFEGRCSLEAAFDEDGGAICVRQPIRVKNPGSRWIFGGRIRGFNGQPVHLEIAFSQEGSKFEITGSSARFVRPDTSIEISSSHTWTRFSTTLTSPDHDRTRVGLVVAGSGTVWIDDLWLCPQ